jgi:hypothetical protein
MVPDFLGVLLIAPADRGSTPKCLDKNFIVDGRCFGRLACNFFMCRPSSFSQ